jgi:hypothetical protein
MRFFLFPDYKGLKKMFKTVQNRIKNPLDTLFNAFINDKINKNVLPYNGIYKRIQGYRQAQNVNPYTCINKLKRLHYSPIYAYKWHNKEAVKQIKKENKKIIDKKKNIVIIKHKNKASKVVHFKRKCKEISHFGYKTKQGNIAKNIDSHSELILFSA